MQPANDVPALDELLARTRVVAIPTRTRFRGVAVREAAILEGPNGASEFSPFLEYDETEASVWLAAAIEFGWGGLPHPIRERIAVNATVPAISADAVPGLLEHFPGCRAAKVKVAERGQALADDIERVGAVREIMGPTAVIRVDANGGWGLDEAEAGLRALAPFRIDYAEQPCATVPELAELRRRLDGEIRVAADESVRKAEDPLAVARAGAADLLVVKTQPLGGVSRAIDVVAQAGLPVVVSSALDTSVGIAMGLHLAAALPEGMLAGACGLGTVALLEGDVVTDPLLPRAGELPVLRPELDPERLERFAASPARSAWWRERIGRCYERLRTAA